MCSTSTAVTTTSTGHAALSNCSRTFRETQRLGRRHRPPPPRSARRAHLRIRRRLSLRPYEANACREPRSRGSKGLGSRACQTTRRARDEGWPAGSCASSRIPSEGRLRPRSHRGGSFGLSADVVSGPGGRGSRQATRSRRSTVRGRGA
jgi:hypothetical protein